METNYITKYKSIRDTSSKQFGIGNLH